MVVRIADKRMYLWRAVDHEGEVLEILIQRRRDRAAAVKLMRKLLRKQGFAPTRLTTDKLRSYGAVFRHLGLSCHHEQGLRENNRGGTRAGRECREIIIAFNPDLGRLPEKRLLCSEVGSPRALDSISRDEPTEAEKGSDRRCRWGNGARR